MVDSSFSSNLSIFRLHHAVLLQPPIVPKSLSSNSFLTSLEPKFEPAGKPHETSILQKVWFACTSFSFYYSTHPSKPSCSFLPSNIIQVRCDVASWQASSLSWTWSASALKPGPLTWVPERKASSGALGGGFGEWTSSGVGVVGPFVWRSHLFEVK